MEKSTLYSMVEGVGSPGRSPNPPTVQSLPPDVYATLGGVGKPVAGWILIKSGNFLAFKVLAL